MLKHEKATNNTEQSLSGSSFAEAAIKKSNKDASINALNVDEAVMLFKTQTCPNCRIAGMMLDKAGIQYKELDADENPELVEKYNIMQAPTLIVCSGDVIQKLNGVSDIKGWLGERIS